MHRTYVRLSVLMLLTSTVFAGCARPGVSTSNWIPPTSRDVANELTVDRPFEAVWDELVGELAKSFYVINNIEKASRLINVSFATDSPEEYIDCGRTQRTYQRGSETQDIDYALAASSTFKYAPPTGNNTVVVQDVIRRTSLEGRANIYVAPLENRTQVTANVKYILTVNVTGTYTAQNVFGKIVQSGLIQPSVSTINFSTNQPNRTDLGTPDNPIYVSCFSTGRLEGDILSFVDPDSP